MKIRISLIFILLFNVVISQERKIIQIIEAGSFDRNENTLPGANILKKDNEIRVHLFMMEWMYGQITLYFTKNNSF